MNLTKKLLIGAMVMFLPYGVLKAQENTHMITQPSQPEKAWNNNNKFDFYKKGILYSIEGSEEILRIRDKDSGTYIRIIEKDHYGNVDSVRISKPIKNIKIIQKNYKGNKDSIIIFKSSGYILQIKQKNDTLTWHAQYYDDRPKDEEVLREYQKYNKLFYNFKTEYNIEKRMRQVKKINYFNL